LLPLDSASGSSITTRIQGPSAYQIALLRQIPRGGSEAAMLDHGDKTAQLSKGHGGISDSKDMRRSIEKIGLKSKLNRLI
jgi:hypothetical protein